MKYFLIFLVIICITLFGIAQEVVEPELEIPEPEVIISDLSVTLIDDVSGQVLNLENAVVQVVGELNLAGDIITYSDLFAEGDVYNVTIWVKRR